MKKGTRTWLIALAVAVFVFGIVLGVAMSWYSSIVPKKTVPTARPKASLPWSDDFADPSSGWQTESDSSAEVAYQDGKLRIFVKTTNRLAWAFAGHEFSDFHLAVEATQVAGPDDNMYGVLVRIQDRDNFYRFSISGDGYYMVDKRTGGEWELLTPEWPESDAINTGGGSTNALEVVGQGETMTFFVNGVQLAQVQDSDHRTGDIGLYAGTLFSEPNVEVHFDNLSITEP
jgi:hypothetical protein